MRRVIRDNTGWMKPGQDLVTAGYAGLAGTVELVRNEYEELQRWFSAAYLEQIVSLEPTLVLRDGQFWAGLGATEWEPSGMGGILTSVWNLSGAYGMGMEFSLRKIPVRQETIEVCERLDCNPYRLYSRGCVLLSAVSGSQLVDRLAGEGISAAVIGRVKDGIARELVGSEGVGYLERPRPDEILTWIPGFSGEAV